MDEKARRQFNSENAEAICAQIRQEADSEVESLRAHARTDADKVLAQAREASMAKKSTVLVGLARDIQKIKENILSSLALEKKRLVLGEKEKFVQSVLEAVKRETGPFRKSDGYVGFLERSIFEGIGVIEDNHIEVLYSSLDEGLMTEAFIKRIENGCSVAMKRACSVKVRRSDSTDLGVIVYSADGRRMYDNRFLTRLERRTDDIERELLKDF